MEQVEEYKKGKLKATPYFFSLIIEYAVYFFLATMKEHENVAV